MTESSHHRQGDLMRPETTGGDSVPGQLVIVSGPSGAGKSTVLRKLMAQCDLPLEMSVSATTRPPRPGEVDGKDYHFVSRQEFERMRRRDEFLECMEVFGRDWYGTLASQVDKALAAGKWIILEIDVQGALSVMDQRSDTLSFFIHPGTRQELERRLRLRSTDEEPAILRRLAVADQELAASDQYDYEIINRDVATAVSEMCHYLKKNAREGKACLKS